jgi:hypothetical protein
LRNETGILGYRGHCQGVTDLLKHLRLRHLDDARVRAEELFVGERVIKRIADDNRGTQVHAAFMLGFARAIAMLCGGVDRAGSLETFFDGGIDKVRHFHVGKAAESRLGIFVIGR